MNDPPFHIQEQAVSAAFDKQAPSFDKLYSTHSIIQYKRQ